MTNEPSDEHAAPTGEIIAFPRARTSSRSAPSASTGGGFKQLGEGMIARHIGMAKDQMTGHWCSHCQGIWFGYALEVECPQCGNRHG